MVGGINGLQGLDHNLRVNRNRAVERAVEPVRPRDRVNIAIEDQAHEFSVLVDCRTTRVTANNVCGPDKVEFAVAVQCVCSIAPARW